MSMRMYALSLLLLPLELLAAAGVYDLELVALRDDIYLIRRPDPLRQPVEGNVVFIVNEHDVVVVDGGGSPLAAKNAIQLIRSVTPKPVAVLITTHWHGDHNLGNQVYRTTFPALRIVSHENTYRHMTGAAMSYVAELPAELDGYIREFESMAAKQPLDERRSAMLDDLRSARRELDQVVVTPADLTFDDELTLRHGAREIQVLHLGPSEHRRRRRRVAAAGESPDQRRRGRPPDPVRHRQLPARMDRDAQ